MTLELPRHSGRRCSIPSARGIIHMELFEDGTVRMCCEILVGGEDVFIWGDDDLIYCDFET